LRADGEALGGYSTFLKSPVSFGRKQLQISCTSIVFALQEIKRAGSRIEVSVDEEKKIFYAAREFGR